MRKLWPQLKVVIDANIAVGTVIPLPSTPALMRLLSQWNEWQVELFAPDAYWSETTSTIRRSVYLKLITHETALVALQKLAALNVRIIASDAGLCRRAFHWATELNQARAYDAFYLALAERLGAELWTGDLRLARACRQHGLEWVHAVGGE